MHPVRGLRAVALLEGAKGVLVLAAGFGLLALVHHDAQHLAAAFVGHLHLHPDSRYPRLFLDAVSNVNDRRLVSLAGFALIYAIVRLCEGYGLWHGRRWAEWLGAASGGIYIPIEIYELLHRAGVIKALILLVNVAIVVYLARLLWREPLVRGRRGGE